MLVATMCNNAVSFTIAQTFLPWSKAWGSSAVFFTLSGFMVLFFCLVTVFLPETKGKSLEEIERMFSQKLDPATQGTDNVAKDPLFKNPGCGLPRRA